MSQGSARAAMPLAAQLVDELRALLGKDMVNDAIRRSEAARKQYEHLVQTRGPEAADAWRRQHWRECAFFAEENGKTIGLQTGFGPGVEPCLDARVVRAVQQQGVRHGKD